MTKEEGGSSHAVYNQGNLEEETDEGDPAFQNLLDCVVNLNVDGNFSPIYKVPIRLKEVNPISFTPRVVSIGPFHRGDKTLKSMEKKKAIYLTQLLTEVGSPIKETLKRCLQKVRGSLEKIKSYYFDTLTCSDDELAQMMVMDACFILQFIDSLSVTGNLYSDNWLRSRNIALDMVLLENQIPFFVLQDIYDLTVQKWKAKPTLTNMLKDLLEHINPFEELLEVEHIGTNTSHFHILDLLHKVYKPTNYQLPKIEEVPTAHSAVELDKVGVRIRPNKNLSWPMAIEFENSMFWRKPTLRMPVVCIDNFFEVVIRNLIAYEQYSPVDNYVTSYAMAMYMLAATPKNIGKLAKSGVIVNDLGSNEKASDMIRSICKNVNFQDFYYVERWENIVQYNESCLARNIKVFTRSYNTPWKVIALLAAISAFIMTVVQFFHQQIKYH